MIRFVDASTVLYAVLKPSIALPDNLQKLKNQAHQIFLRINEGEKVATSVIHLSEIANILEARLPLEKVSNLISDLLQKNNIQILSVDEQDYHAACVLAKRRKVGINDALAIVLMKQNKINEIYSFDKHFDNFNVKRLVD